MIEGGTKNKRFSALGVDPEKVLEVTPARKIGH